ncbi:hypothetical protein PoB_004496700 [Plakobranchus ocellatus]|uniref:Uncharacterized protein n=1 Tax=Plakobranchus ocellatus TaxID=259542 RepID=A0AAV4BGS2_9GAST|nr:hypothetical protein PoB_004496700 [Plakobranchus ocellatus]
MLRRILLLDIQPLSWYNLFGTYERLTNFFLLIFSVGGTEDSESALRSAGTLLPRVRAPSPAPESLRSPCCGLAVYKQSTNLQFLHPILGSLK